MLHEEDILIKNDFQNLFQHILNKQYLHIHSSIKVLQDTRYLIHSWTYSSQAVTQNKRVTSNKLTRE